MTTIGESEVSAEIPIEQAQTQSLLEKLSTINPQLATHLTSILAYIIKTRPKNPLQQFEIISAQIKAGKLPFVSVNNHKDNYNNDGFAISQGPVLTNEPIINACEEMGFMLGLKRPKEKPAINEEVEEEEEEEDDSPPELPTILPNLIQQNSYFRQAGIVLSDIELLQIEAGITAIVQREENASSTDSISFWGKMHTLTNDYYIVEMKKSEYDEDEMSRLMTTSMNNTGLNSQPQSNSMHNSEMEEPPVEDDLHEAMGVGANEFVYYCTTTIHDTASWRILPYVTPLHIQLCRDTRRYLTGDLETPVYGFPRFLGKELHLLRALIARISHGTKIAPTGAYIRDETEDVVIVNESFTGVSSNKLQAADNWQHIRMNLLREGRTEPWVDEEAEESEEKEEKQTEAVIPLLRSCAKDSYSSTISSAFKISVSSIQDTGFIVPVVEKDELAASENDEENDSPKETSHVLAIARSNIWPGAVSIAKGAFYSSVYVGWGFKSNDNSNRRFTPCGPPELQSEYSGAVLEQIDIQPTEEQRKVEEEYQLEQQKEKERQLEEADEEEDQDDLELDMEDEVEKQENTDD